MKRLIHKFIPKPLLSIYHLILAELAAFVYAHPSKKMTVIGVTGTNGKSTVVNLIARILEENGDKVGLTSTMNFKIGDKEWLNNTKMTMLGRFALQKLLRDMVRAGCKYAVIETSSEGIKQHRHKGIKYDLAVFTNLTPEHIEAHGGFEKYKKAKGQLFKNSKIHIINKDDPHAEYFLSFKADKKITFSTKDKNIRVDARGSRFDVNGVQFKLNLLGGFNVSNALAAIAVAQALGVELEVCKAALEKIDGIPGRIELIDEGQDFTVVVDYAYEPASVKALYSVVDCLPHKNIIHLLGSMAGGRDWSRRPELGRMAGYKTDYVVVTNEDPCDEDPRKIIDDVAKGAEEAGKIEGQTLFRVLDRADGIRKALSLAKAGDIVLITGKGSEQVMAVANGKKIPWDDRKVARSIIKQTYAESQS